MQLEEQGLVTLDAPANDYLHTYRLIPANPGWRPATVRHLLTHTAGIREVLHPSGVVRPLFGETVKAGQPVPSLAEYYRRGLGISAEPGTRFRHTDHGFATLGQLVEDVTGQRFDRYLREQVFAPLGMADTSLVRSAAARSRLATGYQLRAGGPKPYPDYKVVTAGGTAAYSTPRDIGRYLAALLGGGANEHGSVLKPHTQATMFAPQYQPDPRIPGVGLAFFRGNTGGHTALEHQGVVPAFTSQIFLAPDHGIGLMAFTNGTRKGMFWLPVESDRLFHHLLEFPDTAIRTDLPHHPELWADLCGWYRLPRPAHRRACPRRDRGRVRRVRPPRPIVLQVPDPRSGAAQGVCAARRRPRGRLRFPGRPSRVRSHPAPGLQSSAGRSNDGGPRRRDASIGPQAAGGD
jgi:CubicO group peptidase (beta-lactamase class C family)